MKKRGHTRDCLDAAEAYLPCICGTDEHNKKVEAMTQPVASEGLPPFDAYKAQLEGTIPPDEDYGPLPTPVEIKDITPIELMVLDFHQVFGHPAPDYLDAKLGTPGLRKLRAELIREEFVDELLPALGLEIHPATGYLEETGQLPDVVEVADALTDILWVTIGAMLAFGMDPAKLMAEVWRSNMSKLGEDGKPIYREYDGKILKGPNYSPPDIKKVLGLI